MSAVAFQPGAYVLRQWRIPVLGGRGLCCVRPTPLPCPPLPREEPPASAAPNPASRASPSPFRQLWDTRRSLLGGQTRTTRTVIGILKRMPKVHLARRPGVPGSLCRPACHDPSAARACWGSGPLAQGPEGGAPAPREARDSLSSPWGGRGVNTGHRVGRKSGLRLPKGLASV